MPFWFVFTLFCFAVLYWFCRALAWVRRGCAWVPGPGPPSHLPPEDFSLDHPHKKKKKKKEKCAKDTIRKNFLFLCSNNWQKRDTMISDLPGYRHEQRIPFRNEESPNWNSLWISTACQVVKVPGWVLPSGANSVCILSTAAILCFCLATARSISFWQVGENGHFPRDSTPRWAQYPHSPCTTGWNLCYNISQY